MPETASIEALTNSMGEHLYVVTMWSPIALDYVVAHVWASDRYAAFNAAHDAYPSASTVTAIWPGTAEDVAAL